MSKKLAPTESQNKIFPRDSSSSSSSSSSTTSTTTTTTIGSPKVENGFDKDGGLEEENLKIGYSIRLKIENDHPGIFEVGADEHRIRAVIVEHKDLLDVIDELAAFTKNSLFTKSVDLFKLSVTSRQVRSFVELLWELEYLNHTPTRTGVKNAGMIYYDPNNPRSNETISRLKSRFLDFSEFSQNNAKIINHSSKETIIRPIYCIHDFINGRHTNFSGAFVGQCKEMRS